MRLGLISDIHGDSVALELAWAHLTVLGADRIICAGDLVGYGPHPDRVVAFLRDHAIDSVRGNHDRWAVERSDGLPGVPSTFGGRMPSAESIEVLRALPPDLLIVDGPRVGLVVHGSPGDDLDFVNRKTHPPQRLDRYLGQTGVEWMLHGHTHRPMLCRTPHGLVINPGSVVSAPVVSTSRTFALLDCDAMDVTFYDVESGLPVPVKPWE